jgi:nucleoside-diphosphate-sugar epimerase
MKVLVTGATGFLGGAVVERLLARGERDLRVTARSGAKRERIQAAAAQYPDARIEYVPTNLSVPAETRTAMEGVGVVYHLAASMRGAPADMFLNTVVASKHLVEAAASARVGRLVVCSSFSVLGVAGLPRGTVVDENTPLESHPERRDVYAQAKLRQELLCRELAGKHGLELTVLRPGVIYGEGGSALSTRVGLDLFGIYLGLGGKNLLPLSYVENCADAIALAGQSAAAAGQTFNVHDDDLPTCDAYLAGYRKEVAPLRVLPVPYRALALLSYGLEAYHHWSKGQLPAVFTPYKVAAIWGGNRFDNSKLKSLGWRQLVPTDEAMKRTFNWLRSKSPAS